MGYHSGAIVTVWPTTCRSRQHSARRLARSKDVLPPCRYTRSIAWRAVAGVEGGQPAAGASLEGGFRTGSDRGPELGDHRAAVDAPGQEIEEGRGLLFGKVKVQM